MNQYSEAGVKRYFDTNTLADIEGIWKSTDGFKYVIEKDIKQGVPTSSKYRMVVLERNDFWKTGYIRAFLEQTATKGVYAMTYYITEDRYGRDLSTKTCFLFAENEAHIYFKCASEGAVKTMLVRMYPPLKSEGQEVTPSPSKSSPSWGTGFAISSDGYLVTNYHVVENAKKIDIVGVHRNYRQSYAADVVSVDKRNDLAILKIRASVNLGTLPFTIRHSQVDVGENVFVLGYPLIQTMGIEVKLTNGIISSKSGFQGETSSYQISVPVHSGNSGAPLFDNRGNLIGIITSYHTQAENTSYAVKVNYLQNLISKTNRSIVTPTTNLIKGKRLTDKVKALNNFIYIVVVNDYEESSNESNRSNNTSTNVAEKYVELGRQKIDIDDYKTALFYANKAIELEANYAPAHFLKGLILTIVQDYNLAIRSFSRQIQLEPNEAIGYYFRGVIYGELKKFKEAIKDLTKYIQRGDVDDSRILTAYHTRGIAYCNNKQFVNAIRDLTFCINNGSIDVVLQEESYYWRAQAYLYSDQFNRGIKDLTIYIKSGNSAYIDAAYGLRGIAKFNLGRNDEGCKDVLISSRLGNNTALKLYQEHCR
ncbi:MAG: trypsin-like peptidase domain-containing protein [Bacteroidales bacterium]